MGKYFDYLVANGVSAEDAKALASPIAEKLHEQQLAALEAAKADTEKVTQEFKDYEDSVQNWYKTSKNQLTTAQNDLLAAKAEEARHRAVLEEMQKKGLFDVAKDLGWTPEKPKVEPTNDDKYISREDFGKLMGDAGVTLARLADLKDEHSRLFPGQRLNTSDLLAESKAKGAANVFDYYEKKFNAAAAREALATKERNDEIAKWKSEGAKEKEAELVSKMANPFTRPGVPSQRPIFQTRTGDAVRENKQPWDHSDGQLQNDRVERATKKLIERQYQN